MAEKYTKKYSASSRRVQTMLNMVSDLDHVELVDISSSGPETTRKVVRVPNVEYVQVPKEKIRSGDRKIDFIDDLYSREYSMTSLSIDPMCETLTGQRLCQFNDLNMITLRNMYSNENNISLPTNKIVQNEQSYSNLPDLTCNESMILSPLIKPQTEESIQTEKTLNDSEMTTLSYTFSNKEDNSVPSSTIIQNKSSDSNILDLTFNDSVILSPQNEPTSTHKLTRKCSHISTVKDTSNQQECDPKEQIILDFDSDDSVRDKNYFPSLTDSSDSSTSEEDIVLPFRAEKPKKILAKPRDQLETSVSNRCTESVPIKSKYIIKRKVPVNKRRNTIETLHSLQGTSTQDKKLSRKRKNTWDGVIKDIANTNNAVNSDVLPERPRKRQKHNTSLTDRKLAAKRKKMQQYEVKEGCNNKCQKKCSTVFDEASREAENRRFWNLTWQERRIFIRNHVSVAIHNRISTKEPKRKPRQMFTLKKTNGVSVHVCKTFFLTTLGFKASNDKVLYNALSSESNVDNRGKHQKTPAFDRKLLTEHVESFHPTEPHYRREHAPLRRYIPSDVTITFMHDDFCKKHPNKKVSYEIYRSHVKKMNVSFTRLGHEECESCEMYALHKKQMSHDVLNDYVADCDICEKWSKHHDKYTKARELYDLHKKKQQSASEIYYSTDLEKVIMLPRLDTFKAVIFCNRLVAYNQTFAPLGKITTESKPLTIIWHDAISGRKQEDIMSAFYSFFVHNRDVLIINIWLDNCSAQNKNWLLYSLIVHMVNSDLIATEKVILHYFEPGHTFMSCDQVHHQVELSMKKKGKLYDFTDFEESVGLINNGKVVVKSMVPQNFLNLTNHVSERRISNSNPRAYLKNMSQVCFQRKNYDLLYKNDFNDDYIPLRFMTDKYLKNPSIMTLTFRTKPKGIEQERKGSIVSKLSGIMPAHKITFWKNLPILNECD